MDKYELQLGSTNTEQFELLKGLPFYIPLADASAKYYRNTINHAIGLPQKNGQPMPFFDYEQMLFDILQTNKHVWIKKATGPRITENILRFMAWLYLKNNKLKDSHMCIVTGPRVELSFTLIDRIKGLFSAEAGFGQNRVQTVSFDIKETVIELNGVHIEAYPSQSLDSMRGLRDV